MKRVLIAVGVAVGLLHAAAPASALTPTGYFFYGYFRCTATDHYVGCHTGGGGYYLSTGNYHTLTECQGRVAASAASFAGTPDAWPGAACLARYN